MAKKKYDFSGWATKSNIRCSDGRTIMPNAFKDNDGETVPLVYNHDHNNVENVIGHALLQNKPDGVYALCSFNDTPNGRMAKEVVRHKDVCSLSIYANKLKQEGNNVTHGHIREVSLVLAGANPGAYIDTIIAHSDDSDEEAVIYNNEKILKMSEEGEDQMEKEENKKVDPNDTEENSEDLENEEENSENEETDTDNENNEVEHSDKEGDDEETVEDVWNGMTEKQQNVTAALIQDAVEQDRKKRNKNNKSEDAEMKHNAFEKENENETITNKENDKETLSHSEFLEIANDAKRIGSMKEAFLQHGITNVEALFPEVQNVTPTPKLLDRNQDWVSVVINGVHNTPFSRVKSTYADITADEARAKGYVKGNQKVEEFISAAKRTTDPVTVYKLQKMDRDDVIDITDFDVLAWLKAEMRGKLMEEIARAIVFGDGRDASSGDKIDPTHIRPIVSDNSVYTIQAKEYDAATTLKEDAEQLIDDVVVAMDDYKGSGNPIGLIRRDVLTRMLLLKDTMGHRLYKDENELAKAMTLSKLVAVPTVIMNPLNIYLVAVDLKDYNVGKSRKGEVNFFDDFDIDYNKYSYLIETRLSGALIAPYSALVFKKAAAKPEPTK